MFIKLLQYNAQTITEEFNICHIIEHFHAHPECYYYKFIEFIS